MCIISHDVTVHDVKPTAANAKNEQTCFKRSFSRALFFWERQALCSTSWLQKNTVFNEDRHIGINILGGGVGPLQKLRLQIEMAGAGRHYTNLH
uniref:Uncharacterized protein n=1 Tax=Romanomermis culicivorax TaxID=13658 RepID=A0A915JR70_ROMCU